MNSEARSLDQAVRDWWLKGADESRFLSILDLALTASHESVVPLARALFIIDQAVLAPTLMPRVARVRANIERQSNRRKQIGQLADLDSDPAIIFAVLRDELTRVAGFDQETIRRKRLTQQGGKASAGEVVLLGVGFSAFTATVAEELRSAVSDLKERERFESWGLFTGDDRKEGIALGIRLVLGDRNNEVIGFASGEIAEQARIVGKLLLPDKRWEANIEWPAAFTGDSIGLPLCVAALTARESVPRDALVASTGRLDISGNVLGVAGIAAKVEAAKRIGIRMLLVPAENAAEARSVAGDALVVVGVSHVDELLGALRRPLSAVDFDFAALTHLVRASAPDFGLVIIDEKEHPHGRCFVAGNTAGKVNVWVYTNGRVSAQGAKGRALEAAERLIKERVPADPEPRPTQSFDTLTPEYRDLARSALEQIGASEETGGGTEAWRFRLRRGRSTATIVSYNTGTCVLQGSAPAWESAFSAMSVALGSVGGLARPESPQSAAESLPDSSAPHIGTDEAGKGDYFGPLVTAAVYVDESLARQFAELGVKDSKRLSDSRVKELAAKIRQIAEGRYAVTPINPPKYNALYEQFRREKKNLNSLLAWGHARSIDQLLSAPAGRHVQPQYVLVDKFADDRHVEERTRRAGIPIHQRPKAESDIAVAAASILARDAFLTWLGKWSGQVGVELPKGASPQVIEAARGLVRRWGEPVLRDVAKVSFRTTDQVLEGIEPAPNANSIKFPWSTDRELARES